MIGAPLPEPKDKESQVHGQQDKREEEIDLMKPRQEADGIEPGVVSEEIPPAHRLVKMIAIPDAVPVRHRARDRAACEQDFHFGMKPD